MQKIYARFMLCFVSFLLISHVYAAELPGENLLIPAVIPSNDLLTHIIKDFDFKSIMNWSSTCSATKKDDLFLLRCLTLVNSTDCFLKGIIHVSCSGSVAQDNAAKVCQILKCKDEQTKKIVRSIQSLCACSRAQRSSYNKASQWFTDSFFGENSTRALFSLQRGQVSGTLDKVDKEQIRIFAQQGFMAMCATGKFKGELSQVGVQLTAAGSTLLHWAIECEENTFFKLLFSLIRNKNIANCLGRTVLHSAVIANNIAMIRFLCDNSGVDINYQDEEGYTALFYTNDSFDSGCEAKKILCAAPGIDRSLEYLSGRKSL